MKQIIHRRADTKLLQRLLNHKHNTLPMRDCNATALQRQIKAGHVHTIGNTGGYPTSATLTEPGRQYCAAKGIVKGGDAEP